MADYNSSFTGEQVDEAVQFAIDGAAKAVLYYDGSTNTVLASVNVSSVTDNALGDYSPNFQNSFVDGNYYSSSNSTNGNATLGSAIFDRVSGSCTLVTNTSSGGTMSSSSRRDNEATDALLFGTLA